MPSSRGSLRRMIVQDKLREVAARTEANAEAGPQEEAARCMQQAEEMIRKIRELVARVVRSRSDFLLFSTRPKAEELAKQVARKKPRS